MARTKRRDEPGAWFHVMNRAVARRTLFENRVDITFFLERIGDAVGRGWIEVHAFTVLHTHFHALVRSPVGRLADAMHDLQLGYVRHFNRSRRRDGPLLRGRFRAVPVDSHAYRNTLVGYIDANPVHARLVARPQDHEFGSCRAYVEGTGPGWLTREWVKTETCAQLGLLQFEGERYLEAFQHGRSPSQAHLVDLRLSRGFAPAEPLDVLLGGAGPAVLAWLRSKARLADGTRPGLALVPAEVVNATIRRSLGAEDCRWERALRAALLRELTGLTFAQIGSALTCSTEAARRICIQARREIGAQDQFAERLATIAHAALVATYGSARAEQFALAGL